MICRRRVVRSKFRHQHDRVTEFLFVFVCFDLLFSVLCMLQRGVHLVNLIHLLFFFVQLADAVKVQKSNHHPWDQSSNYCNPPHASYSKTWSSPSHPHNQQDLCKCKLSHVTALLLASLFSRNPSPPPPSARLLNLYSWCFASRWLSFAVPAFIICFVLFFFHEDNVSFQLWWVGAFLPPPQPHRASAAKAATRCPAPQLLSLPSVLVAPLARRGTGRRTTRAHVWHILLLLLRFSWCQLSQITKES